MSRLTAEPYLLLAGRVYGQEIDITASQPCPGHFVFITVQQIVVCRVYSCS